LTYFSTQQQAIHGVTGKPRITCHESFMKIEGQIVDLEWCREAGRAAGYGLTEVSGPRDELFKEVLDGLEEGEACFKGLVIVEKDIGYSDK